MQVLFVCTGNLCRSPVAERLAAAWARDHLAGSPELDAVEVSSAGTGATAGQAMDPSSARALQRLGGDPEGFISRSLTADLANGADLVLTMTRDHRRDVLELAPRGLRRTFTLAEAAALLPRADLRGLRTMPLAPRARELGRRLDAARAYRCATRAEDIADPIRQPIRVHDEVARAIAASLRPLADVLLASVRDQPALCVPA
jgi:protein-tyrosine phosphatase